MADDHSPICGPSRTLWRVSRGDLPKPKRYYFTDKYYMCTLEVRGVGRTMASKVTSIRLPEQTLNELYFLGVLDGGSTQAKTITEWIHRIAEAVKAQALADNPGMQDDPEFLMNGGTLISVEEQRAAQKVKESLK